MPYRKRTEPAICGDCGAELDPNRLQTYCAGCIRKRRLQAAQRYYERRRLEHEERPIACVGCVFWRPLSGGMCACHYCIDTGKLRKIPAKKCYRHRGTPYRAVLKIRRKKK